jgi:integrase
MAGTYRQKGDGWELCVSMGTDIKGKRIRKYKYVKADKIKEVEALLAEFVSECKSFDYSAGDRLTIEEFGQLWLKDYVAVNLRQRTYEFYKELLPRINMCLGHKKLRDLKPTHIIQFYEILRQDDIRLDGRKGKLSTTTLKHYHACLSSMLGTAVKWQMIKENICTRVDIPKPTLEEVQKAEEKEENIYSIEQTIELLDHLLSDLDTKENSDIRYKMICLISLFTGFRRSEVLGLDWSNLDLDSNTIQVKKTSARSREKGKITDTTKTKKSKRVSYIPEFLSFVLKKYKAWWTENRLRQGEGWTKTDRLFVNLDGQPLHPDKISSWFPVFIQANNMPHMNFHGLRHLHGSILIAMGMDWINVADQMGHVNIQMLVKKYGHNVQKKQKQVAEIMGKTLLNNSKNG